MEVIWSPDSMEDLDFLFEYIAEDSVEIKLPQSYWL